MTVLSSQWKYVPPPLDSVLLWSHCARDLGMRSYQQVLTECDSLNTLAYATNDKIVAIFTFTWQIVDWSAAFSFWLAPQYRRRVTEFLFMKMVTRLEGFLRARTKGRVFYTLVHNKMQAKIANSLGAKQSGVIEHLFSHDAHGYFYSWDIRNGTERV